MVLDDQRFVHCFLSHWFRKTRQGGLNDQSLRGTPRGDLVIALSLSAGSVAAGIFLSNMSSRFVGSKWLELHDIAGNSCPGTWGRAGRWSSSVLHYDKPAQRVWQSCTAGQDTELGLGYTNPSYKLCMSSDTSTAQFVAGGKDAQVGLVHNYMNYEPYTNTWAAKWYLQPVCNTMQYIWGTAVVLKYLQTGKFLWQAPVGSKVEYDEGSKPGLDFIGMNYYGR